MKLPLAASIATFLGVACLPRMASAQVDPWNHVNHGACCEANLAAWGNNTYVLAPVLEQGNNIFRSTDGGRSWGKVYPPLDVSVPYGIEGDLSAWGPPGLSDITVNYFGTQVVDGAAAVTTDGGDNWTISQVVVPFAANDQAWIYASRGPATACSGAPGSVGYAVAGWFRIGSVAVFSCDGGITWPFQTPLIGLSNSGPEHVVCHETAQAPGPDTDTRIPLASFEKMKAHRHGGFGTDGRFYWTEVAAAVLYICATDDFGVNWGGYQHLISFQTASPTNTVTSMAFDQNGTLYVLHSDKLYVSFNQGKAIRYVHTPPHWGNDTSVGDNSGQAFTVDGGTIHMAVKTADHRIRYLKGENVDTANPTWTTEIVTEGGTERLDFIQIVLDGRGVPTIGYTQVGSGATKTSSRDLDPVAVDDTAEAETNSAALIDVLANDFDPDDTNLMVVAVSDPPNGSAVVSPDSASVVYTSDPGFVGSDTFTYTVADPPGLTDVGGVDVEVTNAVSADVIRDASAAMRLGPIRPNPFERATTIEFELARRSRVRIDVFSAGGRRVATLRDGEVDAGRHSVRWSASAASGERLPAGVYFVELSSEGRSVTRRTLHLR